MCYHIRNLLCARCLACSEVSQEPICLHLRLTLTTGKRFNVLHQRTDSWHYEVDQLILGTLLFTLFTFSLPTLLTYGVVFALVSASYGRQSR